MTGINKIKEIYSIGLTNIIKFIILCLPLGIVKLISPYMGFSLDSIGKNIYYRISSSKNGAEILIFKKRE